MEPNTSAQRITCSPFTLPKVDCLGLGITSFVELSVLLMSACLPTLKPLLRPVIGRVFGKKLADSQTRSWGNSTTANSVALRQRRIKITQTSMLSSVNRAGDDGTLGGNYIPLRDSPATPGFGMGVGGGKEDFVNGGSPVVYEDYSHPHPPARTLSRTGGQVQAVHWATHETGSWRGS
jgi:hypothetical protein